MYINSDTKVKQSPESIFSRLISRFKMAKADSPMCTASMNQAEDSEKHSMNNLKENDIDSHEDKGEEEKKIDENRRISLHNLSAFCDQLQNFIKHLQSIHHLQFLTHDYPEILRNRFETDVLELESMLREINGAMTNIIKQKAQQNFVNKEIKAVKKTLNRIKDDEFREMEKVVALYDKTLFTRWESVKTTHKPEVLQTLLTDIKCKQLALENLDTLVTRKLGHLKTFPPLIVRDGDKSNNEKSVIPLPLFPSGPWVNERKSKIPLPPPLPPPPSLASRSNARKLSMQRRARLRREEENIDNFLVPDLDDLPAIPLTFNNGPDNLILNFNGNLPYQLPSVSTISSNSTTSPDELTTSLQEEMDTVLQALFGDLSDEGGPIVVTDESRSDVSTTGDKNIELHELRGSQP